MSTNDVPGANPAHNDELSAGCWAEHEDGSLIYVKGTEDDNVVYEIYDSSHDPPVYYNDAMRRDAFERTFSYGVGDSDIEWVWHDKTPFPWGRVMKSITRPVPVPADVGESLSAAQKIAESLKLRARRLNEDDLSANLEQVRAVGKGIMERLSRALDAFME